MKKIKGIYLVTEEYKKGHFEYAKAALRAGVKLIQLREKTASGRKFLKTAKEVKNICNEYNALFMINDRLDIAMLSGADGIHVGKDDLPVREIRKIVGKEFIVGVSVASLEEAREAQSEGASYVAVSPVFNTSTKEDAGEGLGLEILRQVKSEIDIPVVAIGGINKVNILDVIEAGADCVAVVSAITRAENPEGAARELVELFESSYLTLERGECN